MKRALIAATLALASMASAQANVITGLVNTGIGTAGTLDANYALTAHSSDTVINNSHAYVSSGVGFPFGTWSANNSTSKWITPTANAGQSFDAHANGSYTYELTFDLTGDIASTAAFNARFEADNSATVMLNGHQIGSSTSYANWSQFAASSGFNAGLNTLDFVVTNLALNTGNPTGLRVEFTSSSVTAVPEPGSFAMLLTGLGLMGFAVRRRRHSK